MKLKKIIVGFGTVGSSFKLFITRPRSLVCRVLQPASDSLTATAVMTWSLATIAFVVGAYNIVFGPVFVNLPVSIALPGKGDVSPMVTINSFLEFVDHPERSMPETSSIVTDVTEESMRVILNTFNRTAGQLTRRRLHEIHYYPKGWVGLPKGEYVTANYYSEYRKATAMEQVTAHFEGGKWKVAVYHCSDIPTQSAPTETKRPEIVDWYWLRGFGLSLPDNLELTKPQSLLIALGIFGVLVKPVVPDRVLNGTTATLLLGLFALVTIMCIHPIAKLLRAKVKFADAFRLGVAWISFCGLFSVLWVILLMLVLVHGLGVRGTALLIMFVVFTLPVIPVVMLRGLFAVFGEFYAFSGWQMLCVLFCACLLGCLIMPLTLFPGLLTILWLEPWINLIW